MPNAIDPMRFQAQQSNKITRQDLGIGEELVIGAVGGFVKWHGLEFLIEGLADLFGKINLRLLLV
jgi:hypothetical protein